MKFIPEYSQRALNGIYIIRNTIDNRVYIGECKNFYKRYGRHKSQLLNNKHFNIKLQNFVNKYGIDALEFDILEVLNDNRIDREIEYINKYNSIEDGFNIIKDSRTMAHISKEHRKRAKRKLIGIKRSKDFCKAVSIGVREYYKNNPNSKRKPWTQERKEARKEYIKNHPENYKNRKSSSGNKINHAIGDKCVFSKITESIAKQIKLNILNKVPRKDTIKAFNISVHIYKDIQRGKTWKHVKI